MIVSVEQDGEDLVLPLSEELCNELGWTTDDVIIWEDNGDGSWTLRKKDV